MILKTVLVGLVSLGAVGISWALMGADGAFGALLGAALGCVLSVVNYFVTGQVRKSETPNVKLFMAGVVISFWLLISFVLLVNHLAPALVRPAALTALAAYLAYRGAEVVAATRARGRSSNGSCGIVSHGAKLSLGTLSGTSETESGKETG